jgi:O-antigen ligase
MAGAAILLVLVVRPSVLRGDFRWLDLALILYLALMALQMVPLSPARRLALSPATRSIDLRLRLDIPADPLADTPRPLTLNADATLQSVWLGVAAVLTFWCGRSLFARGGIRMGARGIAGIGLVLAAVGMAQHATAPHSVYWGRTFTYTEPFGPFMNRSDFATWLIMALPLTGGYLLARFQSRQRRNGELLGADAFDNTATFLTVAMGLMAAGLMVGLSRSGLIGAIAAAISLWILSERRLYRQSRIWLLGGVAALALVALAFASTSAVSRRIEETLDTRASSGRVAIWRATLPIIRDFWLTGTGAGAYERAMLVYQPAPHETYFNHAHNEYLQLVSEGGLVLAIPGVLAIVAAVAGIRCRLSTDLTPIYWVRAGAVSGLVAVAVQSLWETGLRRPANTLLFAVIAALAMHLAPERVRSDSAHTIRTLISTDDVARLRTDYSRHQCILLRQLVEPGLLDNIQRRIDQSEFRPFVQEGIGHDSDLVDRFTVQILAFLTNDPSFLQMVREITGCAEIDVFDGRVYRMDPALPVSDSWHDDWCENRIVGMSLNLSRPAFEGGVFQLRDRRSNQMLHEVANTGSGDAIIFRLAADLQHRNTEMTGSVPKTAFAGWFRSHQPNYYSAIRISV